MFHSPRLLLKHRKVSGGWLILGTTSASVLVVFSWGVNIEFSDGIKESQRIEPTNNNRAVISRNEFREFGNDFRWKTLPFTWMRACACESATSNVSSNPSSPTPKPLSRFKLLLYRSKILPHSFLPIPRLLMPNDPVFSYPEFKKGLRLRQKDEIRLNQLLSSKELKDARETQNQERLHSILDQMHCLLYGEGITPQDREDFLIENGCTGFTPEILDYLMELGRERGFVEIGAGNGQWARALIDCHVGYCERNTKQTPRKASSSWEFVQAYDNMKELPLSPKIYHSKTVPAHKHFYHNVKHCTSHTDVVQGYASRGRVLLLVFPPPGPMARETIQAYVNAHKENDTVVYVGEGKGGANGDDDLFDYLLGQACVSEERGGSDAVKWELLKVMNVRVCPGGKGYEKMFVFRRAR